MEENPENKITLYETLGDIASTLKIFDRALDYYLDMLSFAEKTNSRISPALTSVAKTLQDLKKYDKAIPYAKRELELYNDCKEIAKSSHFLAILLANDQRPDSEVRNMFEQALKNADNCGDSALKKIILHDYVNYMEDENFDSKDTVKLKEELNGMIERFPELSQIDNSDDEVEQDIAADVNLDELSDCEIQSEVEDKTKNVVQTKRRPKFAVKKNDKGETQLHVACIKGKIKISKFILPKIIKISRNNSFWSWHTLVFCASIKQIKVYGDVVLYWVSKHENNF